MPAIRSNPGAIDPTSFNQIPKIPKDSLGSWHILPHDFMVDFMEKFMCFFFMAPKNPSAENLPGKEGFVWLCFFPEGSELGSPNQQFFQILWLLQ